MTAMGWLVVSVHDVAPATGAQAAAWRVHLARRQVPATWLVVPGPWRGALLAQDTALVAWLHDRVRAGDEVAQHGWEHRAVPDGPAWGRAVATLVARGCAEFATIGEEEAAQRLRWGRRVLEDLGLPPLGFTAPGWLTSPGAWRALAAEGYRYATSHTAVADLVTGVRHGALALSTRAGGLTEAVGAAVLPRLAARLAARGRPVRVALHPEDLASPRLRSAVLGAIDAALDQGATPITYWRLVREAAVV